MKMRGFTLVELVMVITITGIIAASLTVFLVPAVNSYFDTRRRADLTDMADTALRRMGQDVRRAVPNSVRSVSATCFQLVPTSAGGRYRMAPDTVTAGVEPYIDTSIATSAFDVLSPIPASEIPVNGDWVVIGNQNAGDVYSGSNRGKIDSVASPATGRHRIALNPSKQFPVGYEGGRFVVVRDAEQTVFYTCHGRTLFRGSVNTITGVFTQLADQAACTAAGGAIVATDVENCNFVYSTGSGATVQSGFVWMRLELSRSGESVALAQGVHVDNYP